MIDNYSVGQRIDANWIVLSSDAESKFKTLEYKNDSNLTCTIIADTIISITKKLKNKKQAVKFRDQIVKDFKANFDSVYNPDVSGMFEAFYFKWLDVKTKDLILISASKNLIANNNFNWSIEINNDSLSDQLSKKHDPLYLLTKYAPFGPDFKEYFWHTEFDSVENSGFLQKGKLVDQISSDFLRLIMALNYRTAKCKIELLDLENDTIKVKILNDEFLTEQMGTDGALEFLGETVYSLTESDSINFVDVQMDYGSHASPGVYSRKDFNDLIKK